MVKIVAEDWRLEPGNLEIKEATALMPAVCVVVGMLFNESKKRVVICQELFKEEDSVRSLVVIPTACILSMVELKVGTVQNFSYPIKVDGDVHLLTAEELEEVRRKSSIWENQTIEEQSMEILQYVSQDPKQRLIPEAEINILKEVLLKLKDKPADQGFIHTLQNICMVLLQFIELDPKQTLIPGGRVQLMDRTLNKICIERSKKHDNKS